MAHDSSDVKAIHDGLKSDLSSLNARHHSLTGYTIVITGASRGIGLAIALAAAKKGANIAILAKSVSEDPRIPGTIYSAAAAIEAAGGKALPVQCDIRFENAVESALAATAARFGGIDCLINNASAISPTDTTQTSMKRFDLMHTINIRGTYMVTAKCLPYLRASRRAHGRFPHVLTLSPPLHISAHWFAPHTAYTIAKYGMSMCTVGHAAELADEGIAVNSLWPRTAIATAAVSNVLGGDEMMKRSRRASIVADAAMVIMQSPPSCTGNFFVDDEVLAASGVTDMSKYRVDVSLPESELMPDIFLPSKL